jgi:hypothetical protein
MIAVRAPRVHAAVLAGYPQGMADDAEKPDLMPDPPGGRDAEDRTEGRGEVSQVQSFDRADEPVSDSQAVTGQPTDESGETQVTAAGPNDAPRGNRERTDLPDGTGRTD